MTRPNRLKRDKNGGSTINPVFETTMMNLCSPPGAELVLTSPYVLSIIWQFYSAHNTVRTFCMSGDKKKKTYLWWNTKSGNRCLNIEPLRSVAWGTYHKKFPDCFMQSHVTQQYAATWDSDLGQMLRLFEVVNKRCTSQHAGLDGGPSA